ncbi:C40 family peptidase [Alkaliphilus oremlandii]|uniref:NLP/P60 protein n=1 Tax=Alkaliphilus oremlandii (strain OhILAs) TaxID=350688 RepID=A8MEZ3_ALKOO|nr:SH3 domain-containing protein [Alkaliphilus oremlandii]ABW18472.1 NLP/P60 protein [Alkaliphilus oremlandii OhILAs]
MKKIKGILVITLVLITTVSLTGFAASKDATPYKQFESNIPGVTEEMLYPEFWIKNTSSANKTIATLSEIEAYNKNNIEQCEPIVDLEKYPERFSKEELVQLIQGFSMPSTSPRYNKNGEQVGEAYYKILIENLNLDNLSDQNDVKYGIALRRTEMRTFPTDDRLFSSPEDYNIDRLMETAIYPVEPMVILSESKDGEWYFAQMYNYLAWIPSKDVAITDKSTLFDYINSKDFIVVTGKRVYTNYNPLKPEISELQLDMGVRIPLASYEEVKGSFYDQNPSGNFVIKLPTINTDGNLAFDYALIQRLDDVSIGYLPYTKANIINQAFKFQGERYGWGGMFNGRDCTSFMLDIYRTMGIKLPRNSSEQGKLAAGVFYEMSETMTIEEREKILDKLEPGAGLYMSGHAMLYLGKYKDEYYMIHDFSGFYSQTEGNVTYTPAWSVAVTPLSILKSSGDKYITYMEALYGVRKFILEE